MSDCTCTRSPGQMVHIKYLDGQTVCRECGGRFLAYQLRELQMEGYPIEAIAPWAAPDPDPLLRKWSGPAHPRFYGEAMDPEEAKKLVEYLRTDFPDDKHLHADLVWWGRPGWSYNLQLFGPAALICDRCGELTFLHFHPIALEELSRDVYHLGATHLQCPACRDMRPIRPEWKGMFR